MTHCKIQCTKYFFSKILNSTSNIAFTTLNKVDGLHTEEMTNIESK